MICPPIVGSDPELCIRLKGLGDYANPVVVSLIEAKQKLARLEFFGAIRHVLEILCFSFDIKTNFFELVEVSMLMELVDDILYLVDFLLKLGLFFLHFVLLCVAIFLNLGKDVRGRIFDFACPSISRPLITELLIAQLKIELVQHFCLCDHFSNYRHKFLSVLRDFLDEVFHLCHLFNR